MTFEEATGLLEKIREVSGHQRVQHPLRTVGAMIDAILASTGTELDDITIDTEETTTDDSKDDGNQAEGASGAESSVQDGDRSQRGQSGVGVGAAEGPADAS